MSQEEAKRAHWRNQYAKYHDKKLEWIRENRKHKTREQLDREAAYQRQWRLRNKDYVKMRRLEAYHKDPEKVRIRRRERYWRNRTNILKQAKAKRSQTKQQQLSDPQQPKMTRYMRIAPRPPPREPPTTSMLELIQDLFPDILQVFLE